MIAPVAPVSAVTGSPLADESPPLVVAVAFSKPLHGAADAGAELPVQVELSLVTLDPSGAGATGAAFLLRTLSIGRFEVDLDDGYFLQVDEPQSEIFVANSVTNESLRVWGAAQIELDGADLARFWGTTSIVLGNGTKLTLETRSSDTIPDLFQLDRLTVTREERALIIENLADEIADAVNVTQSLDGYTIDTLARDGLTIERVADGWAGESGETVDAAFVAQTVPGGEYGPDTHWQSLAEASGLVADFLSWGESALTIARTIDDSRMQIDDAMRTTARGRERHHLALALAVSAPPLAA